MPEQKSTSKHCRLGARRGVGHICEPNSKGYSSDQMVLPDTQVAPALFQLLTENDFFDDL